MTARGWQEEIYESSPEPSVDWPEDPRAARRKAKQPAAKKAKSADPGLAELPKLDTTNDDADASTAARSKDNDGYVKRSASSATWRPERGAAEVFEQRGKLLMRMGFIHRGKIHIHLEEAVYLMERGQLKLFSPDVEEPMTLRQAFELMLTSGVTKDQFLVYCHLMEGAFIVRRHPSVWTLPPKVHPSTIWGGGAWASACPKPGGAEYAEEDEPATTMEPECVQELLHLNGHKRARSAADEAGEEDAAEEENTEACQDRGAKRQRVEAQEAGQQPAWWPAMAEDAAAAAAAADGEATAAKEGGGKAEEGAAAGEAGADADMAPAAEEEAAKADVAPAAEEEVAMADDAPAAKEAGAEADMAPAADEEGAKADFAPSAAQEAGAEADVAAAAEDECAGINKASTARGVVVVEEANIPDLPNLKPFPGMPAIDGVTTSADIAFDVHKPNSRFSRKNPDGPAVHIGLLRERVPPSRERMLAAEAVAVKGAAVCFAYVTAADVALYAFEKIELPSLM